MQLVLKCFSDVQEVLEESTLYVDDDDEELDNKYNSQKVSPCMCVYRQKMRKLTESHTVRSAF